MGGDEYTAKMDEQMPEATILLFRRLAHAKVSPDARCGMHGSTLCVSTFCWLHVEIWQASIAALPCLLCPVRPAPQQLSQGCIGITAVHMPIP